LNNYGHLCIREFDDPKKTTDCCLPGGRAECIKDGLTKACRDGNYQCEHYKITRLDEEHLIVLDQKTTNELIQFIFTIRSTYELKELLKGIVKNELPF
jgi:hypothetical protein